MEPKIGTPWPELVGLPGQVMRRKWEFPKIGGTFIWGPYNKDPTNLGYYIRVPYFRKPPNSFLFPVVGTFPGVQQQANSLGQGEPCIGLGFRVSG